MLECKSPAPMAPHTTLESKKSHTILTPKAPTCAPRPAPMASHRMTSPPPMAPKPLPHAVARLVVAESGFLDFATLTLAARVSRNLGRLATSSSGAGAIGRSLDLSKYGEKLSDERFARVFRTRVRFKGRRRVRNVSVRNCTRLSSDILSEFVSHFNTNPLTLDFLPDDTDTDSFDLNDKLEYTTTQTAGAHTQGGEKGARMLRYTSAAYGNGMRIFVWQAGGDKDWDVQRVLYRCCDMWCSVRNNKHLSVQIELFLWIRSEDVLRSITPDELAFALQALRDHKDYDAIHASLLTVCRSHRSPRNVIPEKIFQLEDSAIYIGTICPGNCCLQVMAKHQRCPPAVAVPATVTPADATAEMPRGGGNDGSGSGTRHHARSISAPMASYRSRRVWRTSSSTTGGL